MATKTGSEKEYYISPLRKQLNMLYEPSSFHGHVSDGFALALKHIAWIRLLWESKSYSNTMLSTALHYLEEVNVFENLGRTSQMTAFLPEAIKHLQWIFYQMLVAHKKSWFSSAAFICSWSTLKHLTPLGLASCSLVGGHMATSTHEVSTSSYLKKRKNVSRGYDNQVGLWRKKTPKIQMSCFSAVTWK